MHHFFPTFNNFFFFVNIQDVGATAKDSFGSLSGKYKMVSDKVI